MSCGCGSTYILTPGDRLYLSAMVKALQQRVSALEGGGIGSDLDVFITQKLQTILPSWTLQPLPPEETDPTIPLWAKQSTKPSYTAAEVGATSPEYVNQIATIVANNAASALNSHATRVDNPHNVTAAQLGAAAVGDLAPVAFTGDYNDLLNLPPQVPSIFVRPTDASLSALVVVWEDTDGTVRPLDYTDSTHIDMLAGLTITAAGGGGSVKIQRAGPLEDSSWSWAFPGRIYLGASGILTQAPAPNGYNVLIGYAVSPTRVYLDVQDPIFIGS